MQNSFACLLDPQSLQDRPVESSKEESITHFFTVGGGTHDKV
jgi:hypothetical protein